MNIFIDYLNSFNKFVLPLFFLTFLSYWFLSNKRIVQIKVYLSINYLYSLYIFYNCQLRFILPN